MCFLAFSNRLKAAIAAIRRLKPDILYMETSSNPLTVVSDMGLLTAEVKAVNPRAISIVDNTYTTPLLVKPLSLGVDVVLHSMTKYINGHGDVLAGLIASNNKEYMEAVKHTVIEFGTTLSPWDAWLTLRGLRTLGVRMDKIGQNALQVSKYLYTHSGVSRVYYPGLPSHPQFSVVKKLLSRKITVEEEGNGFPFSGMISFDINVGDDNEAGTIAVKTFLDSMQLISSQVYTCLVVIYHRDHDYCHHYHNPQPLIFINNR
jgi:methionine-gamma-lyase